METLFAATFCVALWVGTLRQRPEGQQFKSRGRQTNRVTVGTLSSALNLSGSRGAT